MPTDQVLPPWDSRPVDESDVAAANPPAINPRNQKPSLPVPAGTGGPVTVAEPPFPPSGGDRPLTTFPGAGQ